MDIKWEDIIGHSEQKKQLQLMLRDSRLPHALLFAGPAGIGKKRLGRALAAAILCLNDSLPCGKCDSCRQMVLEQHPDYYEVLPEKRDKSAGIIRIEQIRDMQLKAGKRPVLATSCVILIDDAELMNEAAANSLLKTLEEPEGNATFILITSARSSLLDTIISRCMLFSFGMLPIASMQAELQKRGLAVNEASKLASLADGSLGQALNLYENGGLKLRADAWQILVKLPAFSMEDVWAQTKIMSEFKRDKLNEWLMYFNMLLRDMLILYDAGASTLLYNKDMREELAAVLPNYPQNKVWYMLKEVSELQHRLTANVNLRLQLEGFFIRIL